MEAHRSTDTGQSSAAATTTATTPRRHARLAGASRQSLAPLIFGPIVAYLALMLMLAAFVVHPPALGWIGFGVSAAVVLAIGAVALALIPRMRTNAVRLHPREGLVYRLLIVTDVEAEPAEISSAVRLRVLGRRGEVSIVTPVIATPLHFLAADEAREHRAAAARLQATLRSLVDAGIKAHGVVGSDDPLEAVGDVLAGFPADEILLVASLPSRRGWLDEDFEERARDLFGVPVSTVFGSDRERRPVAAQR